MESSRHATQVLQSAPPNAWLPGKAENDCDTTAPFSYAKTSRVHPGEANSGVPTRGHNGARE